MIIIFYRLNYLLKVYFIHTILLVFFYFIMKPFYLLLPFDTLFFNVTSFLLISLFRSFLNLSFFYQTHLLLRKLLLYVSLLIILLLLGMMGLLIEILLIIFNDILSNLLLTVFEYLKLVALLCLYLSTIFDFM